MEKKTPLYDVHVEEGGKIVPFAGYLLPVQYGTGVIKEHMAVREQCGLFDVSHMGEVLFTGPTALDTLNHLLTNDYNGMPVNKVRYSAMCNEKGGTIDDLVVYKFGEESYLAVVNAANREKDFAHMAKNVLPKYFGGISEKEVQEAADAAYAEYEAHMAKIRVKGSEIIDEARRQGKRIIVLAGRPYHVDPEINHGIDHLITRHGAAVVTEDSISNRVERFPTSVLNQWTYHSRLYAAAKYCTTQKDMDLVQLVSFGCGVDAITTDETREILQAGSKLYTQLKIDEITNLGAVNIRLRSLFAALEERDEAAEEKAAPKAEA